MDNPYNLKIHWLPDEEYHRATEQLRLQMNGVFAPFGLYGLDVFVPGAIDEVIKLCEDFGLRVRGIDKPLSLEEVRRRNGRGK
jgi:hypothetical protein